MVQTVAVDMEAGAVDLDLLSQEFASVAERIQRLLEREDVQDLDVVTTEEIEVAERTVDARARDLRSGFGDRHEWASALEAYEQAWMRAIRAPVEYAEQASLAA